MDTKEVLDKLSWYQQQYYQVSQDERLNAAARDDRLANLRREQEKFAPVVYDVFAQAWLDIRRGLASVDASRRLASQKMSDAWSYESMRYYRELARDDIAKSANLQELEKHIKSMAASGSKEQARAYLESGGAVIAKYRGTPGLGSMVAWMEQEAAKLTTPAEFAQLDERQAELVLSAVTLRDRTVSAANMLPQSNVVSLLKEVSIGMRADSVSGRYEWTLDFAEPVAG